MLEALIALPLILAYIVSPYFVAKRKGKNPWLWTFLCLFIFPMWIFLLFSKNNNSSRVGDKNKSSWIKKATIGAVAVKTYQNVYNKPIVTAPPGFVIKGLKQKGLGATWEVKYTKSDQMNLTHSFTIKGTAQKATTIGNAKFVITWP